MALPGVCRTQLKPRTAAAATTTTGTTTAEATGTAGTTTVTAHATLGGEQTGCLKLLADLATDRLAHVATTTLGGLLVVFLPLDVFGQALFFTELLKAPHHLINALAAACLDSNRHGYLGTKPNINAGARTQTLCTRTTTRKGD